MAIKHIGNFYLPGLILTTFTVQMAKHFLQISLTPKTSLSTCLTYKDMEVAL